MKKAENYLKPKIKLARIVSNNPICTSYINSSSTTDDKYISGDEIEIDGTTE